jgi:hypothetical protein
VFLVFQCTVVFKSPHRLKSTSVKSGDRGGHSTLLFAPSNFSLCKMWLTLVSQAPASRQHCCTDLLKPVWRSVTLSQHFHIQLNCQVFRSFLVHILHCSISPEPITQPCNCYACWWRCHRFISPTSLHLVRIFPFQRRLRIHLDCWNINRGSAILSC